MRSPWLLVMLFILISSCQTKEKRLQSSQKTNKNRQIISQLQVKAKVEAHLLKGKLKLIPTRNGDVLGVNLELSDVAHADYTKILFEQESTVLKEVRFNVPEKNKLVFLEPGDYQVVFMLCLEPQRTINLECHLIKESTFYQEPNDKAKLKLAEEIENQNTKLGLIAPEVKLAFQDYLKNAEKDTSDDKAKQTLRSSAESWSKYSSAAMTSHFKSKDFKEMVDSTVAIEPDASLNLYYGYNQGHTVALLLIGYGSFEIARGAMNHILPTKLYRKGKLVEGVTLDPEGKVRVGDINWKAAGTALIAGTLIAIFSTFLRLNAEASESPEIILNAKLQSFGDQILVLREKLRELNAEFMADT